MSRHVGIKPRWVEALALWVSADHYSFWQAIRKKEFRLPLQRILKVYRFRFGGGERYLVSYFSSRRECLVVLEKLPAELASLVQETIHPMRAARLLLQLIWKEPTAVLSLLMIPLPILCLMLLFLVWVNFVLQNRELLALFANASCDAQCVEKVIKIHSMVAVLFLTPFALVFLPVTLMIFQAPRYRSALNYRIAQSYCAITVAFGVYALVHLMVFFPFKGYGKFVMVGFGPKAERFLDAHGLRK